MRFAYNIGVRFYWLAAWIAARWNPKAKKWIGGRKGWYAKLRSQLGPGDRVIWFHCASLGEFEQGRPLMEETRKRFPAHKIMLTFFSPSGYEKRKSYEHADLVIYLPLDTARNARLITGALRLEMVIFIKYEFWYHILNKLSKQETPLFLASGIFRPGQLFFRWYGKWYRKFLECFTHIYVQHEASRSLLTSIGIDRVSVAGDTRFDRVQKVAGTPYHHPALERLADGRTTIVAGSTWERDEQILSEVFRELSVESCWIIAPHELSEAHLKRIQQRFPGSIRFSDLDRETPTETRVIIIDTIGLLSFLYRFGTLAYVGGGFGKGIHNILEAAAYGIPVIFGPVHEKFREAVELVEKGGAFTVLDRDELLSTIHQQLNHSNLLKASSETALNYVQERVGATSRVMDGVCTKSGLNML
jgi:3-deoxy-D-manno-octulosonic-acid transferase